MALWESALRAVAEGQVGKFHLLRFLLQRVMPFVGVRAGTKRTAGRINRPARCATANLKRPGFPIDHGGEKQALAALELSRSLDD
jgi:hypothetical protein